LKNSQYQLTIRFDFDAIDNIEARIKAKQILKDSKMDGGILNGDHPLPKIKLQQILIDKLPMKVEL
jgi:hypothetical protein